MKNDKPVPPLPDKLIAIIQEHRLPNSKLLALADFLIGAGSDDPDRVGPVLLDGDEVLSCVAELTWYRSQESRKP
jgi:hypothetical protein